jgi:mycothiol synthase
MDEPDVEVVAQVGPAHVATVARLLDDVRRARGVTGLSEARRRALERAAAGPTGLLAVTARDGGGGPLVGYAQIDDEGDRTASSGELVVLHEGGVGSGLADRLLDTAVDAFRAAGGGHLRFWVTHAGPSDDTRATSRGFTVERDLLQLRCPLPLPASHDGGEPIATRAFRPGVDEQDWLRVNNRAFTGHPEQGHWDLEDLLDRESEPWFTPDGFRVLEVDGRLAGSCWTKVHDGTRPPLGEIYVISVDPDFHGRGLGRTLTRAGLEWLASVGVATGMLYVDGANTAALTLYRSMGFTTHHVDRSYVADLPPGDARR